MRNIVLSADTAADNNIIEVAFVLAVHKERYELEIQSGKCFGVLKTSNYYTDKEMTFPTVGDRVEVWRNPNGDSLILKTLPRKSVFMRLNPTSGMPDQAVAANFDYVFIVLSCNKDFNLTKLERYLTEAWQSGATPVILLTKQDLYKEGDTYLEQAVSAAPGVDVIAVSTITGYGMESLRGYLVKGKTAVFLGSSGVGKSSLINSLMECEVMKTNGIREKDAQGHHTTTYRQCFTMENGARLIDTPGMRKVMMSEDLGGMSISFTDVEELIGQCKFRNCTHISEPGCAIQAAIHNGTLSKKHWDTYHAMQREEAASRARAAFLAKKRLKKYGMKTQKQSKNCSAFDHNAEE